MPTPTLKQLAAANAQLREDFKAIVQSLGSPQEQDALATLDGFRMFCFGVIMCTQSLKGFVEDDTVALIPGMTPEECCDAYYSAARKVIDAH